MNNRAAQANYEYEVFAAKISSDNEAGIGTLARETKQRNESIPTTYVLPVIDPDSSCFGII